MKNYIICLQETFYNKDYGIPAIPEYTCILPEEQIGKVAIYIRNKITPELQEKSYVIKDSIQCIKLSFMDYDLITINYYPPTEIYSEKNLHLQDIYSLINDSKPTIINESFNL